MAVTKEDTAAKPPRVFRCSFCGKSQADVKKLISGPGVFICDECVALCVPIVEAKSKKPNTPTSMFPENWPTEQLMTTLGGYNGAFESIGESMQDVVDILREREISWAAIGENLGVSRQSAWKRFG